MVKPLLLKIYWIMNTQFGLNILAIARSIISVPRFVIGYFTFKSKYKGKIEIMPCLQDWFEEGGTTESEYFWQDLYVAKLIFQNKPINHVDIGSRIDGFIAHLASFRDVTVLDVRKITSEIPSVTFKQADLMSEIPELAETCDSLSCLHTLEHFGLGRYGDPITSKGYKKGLKNMADMIKPNGLFYLSTPIGVERAIFNANYVFAPQTIINLAADCNLQLESVAVVSRNNKQTTVKEISSVELVELANKQYSLGIFVFKKKS